MRPLAEYKRKRDFKVTSEPGPLALRKRKDRPLIFVVQEHHASHLHYDFRLEWKGVLKSWAVPKGPSLDPKQRRLAVEVEDHPIPYADFEGRIPKHQYGAGEVFRWDFGTWEPMGDVDASLRKGRLEFRLKGKRLNGGFLLVRTRSTSSKPNWLLIKRHDSSANEREEVKIAPAKRLRSKARDKDVVEFVPPQLAQLVDGPPKGDDWVHEIKFDGYRTQAHIHDGKVQLFTRSGKDWTEKYPMIAKKLKKLNVDAVLDGEVVWLDEDGRSNFQLLQNALKGGRGQNLVYYAFDLLFEDGKDMTSLPLIARKDRLARLVKGLAPSIRYSEHFRGVGEKMMHVSCQHDLEGVVSKRVDTPYVSGRHDDWVKSKCIKRQELVIGGFSEGEGARTGFGSLLLGFYEGGKLRYAGRCGTGFNQQSLREITRKLHALEVKRSPFDIRSPRGRDLHWVKPKLVAEVAFSEWTKDGVMRAPVFHGLRSDKAPASIGLEKPKKVLSKTTVTHPDKVIFKKENITKGEVAEYYQAVSPWLLPHIKDRPLSLVRCPQGSTKPCFYSKHLADRLPPEILSVPQADGEPPFIAIDSDAGLHTLIQRGTLEIHPWQCHRQNIEMPDQIVMDFDPDPSVDFEQVKEGVWELKEILDQLNLTTFLKLTGGKGLHLQFPVAPIYSWDQLKQFAHTLAQELTARHPNGYTANLVKKARKGKIFVDYLRNGRGATAVAPYSLRAREISAVAMPIAWTDLEALPNASVYTLPKALEHLKQRKKDPWQDFFEVKQEIEILGRRSQGRDRKLRSRARKH